MHKVSPCKSKIFTLPISITVGSSNKLIFRSLHILFEIRNADEISREYWKRFGKIHKSVSILNTITDNEMQNKIPDKSFTEPPKSPAIKSSKSETTTDTKKVLSKTTETMKTTTEKRSRTVQFNLDDDHEDKDADSQTNPFAT